MSTGRSVIAASHRHKRDQQTGQAEAAHERQRHEQHERKPDRDRGAAEEDGAAGRGHRHGDGVLLRPSGLTFLAVPVHHQQRVVDGDPEPDQRDHVGQVGRERHVVREDPDEGERGRDRDGGEHEREQECERPEDENEDHERDRDRDQHLADEQVTILHRLEIPLDRRLAAHVERGAGDIAGRLAHGAGVALRVGRLELGDDAGGNDVAGDGPNLFELARLERGGGPTGRGTRRLDERRR